jgi:putative sigma-54 modulation protein
MPMPDFSRKRATFHPDDDHKEQAQTILRNGCQQAPGSGATPRFHHAAQESNMQTQVSGHQIEITPALRDYVDARRERLVRHFDNLTSLNVVLEVEKNRLANRAEGTLAAAGTVLHADAVDQDMYAAIDALFDKLDAQVRKHKDKKATHDRDDIRNMA